MVVAPGPLVLVVDDNAQNRALAQATLEDDGYPVRVACDGAEALAAYAAHQPACILLDIHMPGLDGISVCTRIRAQPGGEVTAIVFVTAQRDVAVFDRALAAGGDDFLTKPYRPSELVVRVQTALRLRRLAGERSELVAQVVRQRDDLQRLQLQQEQLSAFLVHDLKNPVAAIALQAELILRDPAASERGRSAATAIRSDARALDRMILDLLDLACDDEGRLAPVRAPIDLAHFVGGVLEEHRADATRRGVALALELATDQPLHADPGLLQRVLANLVDNALRHAPEASEVQVAVARTGDAVELRVSDRGTGIPEPLRELVFRRYQTSGGPRHHGLGLAFCRVAIEAHGGRIWVEDANPGATFCARLPDDRG